MGGDRHTIRMNGYDYSTSGYYFVTICTHDRECLFGEDGVINQKGLINQAPTDNLMIRIVENEWKTIPVYFPNVHLDEFIIMPNHVHGIVIIQSDPVVGVSLMKPDNQIPLGKIIRRFKARCSFELHKMGLNHHVWQRNYYERIIRNERELNFVRKYIQNNPQNWETDKENPTI